MEHFQALNNQSNHKNQKHPEESEKSEQSSNNGKYTSLKLGSDVRTSSNTFHISFSSD